MMVLMARGLLQQVLDARKASTAAQGEGEGGGLMIDIGVTKKPFFMDKAASIDESGVYGEVGGDGRGGVPGGVEQVHLVGFDTLTRIFDKKYYPERGLKALEPFLERHRIRALSRPDESGDLGKAKNEEGWGGRDEQEEWVRRIERGEREGEGLRREWAGKIELVDGGGEMEGVSSTKAREAVKREDWAELEELLGKEVADYVKEQKLYQEDEKGKI